MSDEPLALVDERGRPAGAAPRRLCHGNPALIQAVVHLFVFDPQGRLYLQRRAAAKDTFPGRWDTSVGGHMAPGETPEQALRREAREELGLELKSWKPLPSYLFRTDWESEYVFPFRTVHEGELHPDPEEVAAGRFFGSEELQQLLAEEPDSFTPHFRFACERLASICAF